MNDDALKREDYEIGPHSIKYVAQRDGSGPWQGRGPWPTGSPLKKEAECPTTQALIDKLLQRDKEGMERFGMVMGDNPAYTPIQLLREAQEEAIDLARYLQLLIEKMETAEKYAEWRNRDKPHILPTH